MKVSLKLDQRFRDKAKGRFEKYEFEVGVLKNAPHKKAYPKSKGLKTFAGGPARKTSPKISKVTIADVSRFNRRKTDYLRAPFKKRTSDIIRFSSEFFKLAFGRSTDQRVVNYLQAIVRNPILRGDYKNNKRSTVKKKGFNRYMIDTAQLFRSITARVKKGA